MKAGYKRVLILCCAVTLVAFVFLKNSSSSSAQRVTAVEDIYISSSTTASVPAPLATNTPQAESAASDMKTYTNTVFDFSLTFPSDLAVTEYDEGGGTKSIVFQKPNTHVGFEMFITPDTGDDTLTPADIVLDFPTLEMEGTESLTVGTGTKAVAFASAVPGFGPDSDVWLVHDGYLFEIVTYPNLGSWLTKIINTIRFP
jgi:hypothetical protein